jgi:hypothetical protein
VDKRAIQLKKLFFILFLIVIAAGLAAQQNVYSKIAVNYFRANPFDREWSKFLLHLMNDPMLLNKSIARKTDSTLFSFSADYKNFSPFGFVADRTEIKLMEKEIEMEDSVFYTDTILVYQILGYKSGAGGDEPVKKEFSKFNRRYKNNFSSDQHSNILRNEQVAGEIVSYYSVFADTSPLSVSWAKVQENQFFFSIVFRFKIRENLTILPISPDGR